MCSYSFSFFLGYGTPAIAAILVINKLMQVILCCEAMRIEVVLMFIYSSYEVIRHSNIQSRSCIGHNIHSKDVLRHPAIISERFRTSRNDIHTKAGRPNIYKHMAVRENIGRPKCLCLWGYKEPQLTGRTHGFAPT